HSVKPFKSCPNRVHQRVTVRARRLLAMLREALGLSEIRAYSIEREIDVVGRSRHKLAKEISPDLQTAAHNRRVGVSSDHRKHALREHTAAPRSLNPLKNRALYAFYSVVSREFLIDESMLGPKQIGKSGIGIHQQALDETARLRFEKLSKPRVQPRIESF